MNKEAAAVKMARELGIDAVHSWGKPTPGVELIERFYQAAYDAGAADERDALRERLAQPEQEPMLTVDALRVEFERPYKGRLGLTRLSHGNYLCPAIDKEWQQFVSKYTPPQRTWVELTDADIDQVSRSVSDVGYAYERALLAKFKEKNT